MPTENADRTGHGQLVHDLVSATLLELLTRGLEGKLTEPAMAANKITTTPGVWFEETERLASVGDVDILEKIASIIDKVQKRLDQHGVTLARSDKDALTVSMTAIFAMPNPDIAFDTLAEGVMRRLFKTVDQFLPANLPDNYAELRARFEKDVRRILGRLRYRKASGDATDDALVGRTGYLLGQLGCAWSPEVLQEFNTFGTDLWELLKPYREGEAA